MLGSPNPDILRFGERLNVAHERDQEFTQNVIEKNKILVQKTKEQDQEIERLQRKIKRLNRALHEKGSDNPPVSSNQNQKNGEDSNGANSSPNPKHIEPAAKVNRRPKGRKKKNYGKNAKTIVKYFKTDDGLCPCSCGGGILGYDENSLLRSIPAQYYIELRCFARYRCRLRETVIATPFEPKLIRNTNFETDFIAGIAVSKFSRGLPCYRQEQILREAGMELKRSTFNRWLIRVANEVLSPLYNVCIKSVLSTSTRLHMDETPIPLQMPGTGKVERLYFYAIVRDDSTFGGNSPPMTAYFARKTRAKYQINEILGDYEHLLQTDGYAGYGDRKNRAECNAHARRHFSDEAFMTESDDVRKAIDLFKRIFAIEKPIKGFAPHIREEVRQREALPIWNEFHDWLAEVKLRHLENQVWGGPSTIH